MNGVVRKLQEERPVAVPGEEVQRARGDRVDAVGVGLGVGVLLGLVGDEVLGEALAIRPLGHALRRQVAAGEVPLAEQRGRVAVLAEDLGDPVQGQGHADHHLWPERGEDLHLVFEVLGPLPPLVESRRARLAVGGHHLGPTPGVGPLQARADGPVMVPYAHAVDPPGVGARRPRLVSLPGPLQIGDDPGHHIGVLHGPLLDAVPLHGQPLHHLVEGPRGQDGGIDVPDVLRPVDEDGRGADLGEQP